MKTYVVSNSEKLYHLISSYAIARLGRNISGALDQENGGIYNVSKRSHIRSVL